ncbi:DUF2591 domain-containing protein [Salmonella enterica subsp. enterica]|nr:DUF2591 domain-containing protein [Salmonella enterica subsp. enterica]
MDYSKLSDQEINMAVAEIFHPDSMVIESKSRPPCACITGHLPSLWVDYCNNPADAWPIIVGKKLSLINADDKWLCVPEDEPIDGVTGDAVHMIYSGGGVEHENPLRAAMIVFLMMQDLANVQDNPA